MRAMLLGLAALLTVVQAEPAASSTKRMALIVGIGNYVGGDNYIGLGKLDNPAGDATKISNLLAASGFDTKLYLNLNYEQFSSVLQQFKVASQEAGEVVVYFAGHGMTVLRDNQLVNVLAATDASINCDTRAAERTVLMEDVLGAVSHVPKQMILFDSCRDNPIGGCSDTALTRALKGFLEPRIGADRGASRHTVSRSGNANRPIKDTGSTNQPASSILVGYSTGLGQTASDGPPGAGSPFAVALLDELAKRPLVPVAEVLSTVAQRIAATGSQRPAVFIDGGAPEMCAAGTNCELRAEVVRQRQLAESQKLAVLAEEALKRGDVDSAIGLALEGLPVPDSAVELERTRAYPVETQAILARALNRGRSQLSLSAHNSEAFFLNYSPDGTRLVTSGYDPFAALWDPIKGRLVARLPLHPDPYVMSRLSPSGRFVAALGAAPPRGHTYGGKSAAVWSSIDGRQVAEIPAVSTQSGGPDSPRDGSGAEILSFIDDDRLLVGARDGIAIWHIPTKSRVGTIPTKLGGYVVAFGGTSSNRVVLLQSFSGGPSNRTSQMEFWDLDQKKLVRRLIPHKGSATAVASNDGRTVYTASSDQMVRAWDLATASQLWEKRVLKSVNKIAISNDDRRLAIATDDDNTLAGDIVVWDLTRMELETTVQDALPRGGRSIQFNADGKRLLATSFSAAPFVYDLEQKRTLSTITQPSASRRLASGVSRGIFSPTGDWIAIAGDNGEITIRQYSFDNSQLLHSNATLTRVKALVFAKDTSSWMDRSQRIQTLTGDLKTALLNTSGDGPRHDLSLIQLAERQLALTHANGEPVRIWDLKSGSLLIEEPLALATIEAVAVDGSSNRLVLWQKADRNSKHQETRPPEPGDRIQEVGLLDGIDSLIVAARQRLSRCLPSEQRLAAGLKLEPPAWCQSPAIPPHTAANRDRSGSSDLRSASVVDRAQLPVDRASPLPKAQKRDVRVKTQLASDGQTRQIGLQIRDMNASMLEGAGFSGGEAVWVLGVTLGSPAEQAGFRHGDIVTGVNGKRIWSGKELISAVQQTPDEITIEYWRISDDRQVVINYLRHRAEADDVAANAFLAQLSHQGQWLPRSETMYWLSRAAQLGDKESMNQLGDAFFNADGAPPDYGKAAYWFEKAAGVGHLLAMRKLTEMLKMGRGIPQDDERAFDWSRSGAVQGDTVAMNNIAFMLDEGKGTKRDSIQAARWLFRSVSMGDEFALKQVVSNSNAWSVEFRRAFQTLLQQRGVYSGKIDGTFGYQVVRGVERLMGDRR